MRTKYVIVSKEAIEDDVAVLEGPLFHHICKVLRLKEGASLVVGDGEGHQFEGTLKRIHRGKATVALRNRAPVESEPRPELILIYGVATAARTELVLQKATELGVQAILPVICERSIARPQEVERKLTRWTEIVAQAARQSERAWLPHVVPVQPLASALNTMSNTTIKLVAHIGGESLDGFSERLGNEPASVAVLIGPEGGLTETEISAAETCGFEQIGLGSTILRTETAAIASLSLIAYLTGRMKPNS